MKKEILKIIPDFDKYFLIDEWEEMTDIDICYRLEHELDLYRDYKEEGFINQQEVSFIKKENIKKVNGLLRRYYNNNI